MRNFLSALLGGLVVVAFTLLSAPNPLDPNPLLVIDQVSAAERKPDRDAWRRIRELEDRMRALESARTATKALDSDRTALAPPNAVGWEARLQKLEMEISDLQEQVRLSTFAPSGVDNPEEARRMVDFALASLQSKKGRSDYLAAMARIPVNTQFLESWPRDKRAANQLSELTSDYLTTRQHHKARDAISRYGPKMGLPELRLAILRLYAAYDGADRIDLARRVVNSANKPSDRAWAMSELARGLEQSGQDSEALATTEKLNREFANTENCAVYIRNMKWLHSKILAGR